MTDETKMFLAQLDEVLAKGDKTSVEVWDVLTALRSMDGGHGMLKACATIPIRRAALPKCMEVAEGKVSDERVFSEGGPTVSTVRQIAFRATFQLETEADGTRIDVRALTNRISRDGYNYKRLNGGESHFVDHAIRAARVLGLPETK